MHQGKKIQIRTLNFKNHMSNIDNESTSRPPLGFWIIDDKTVKGTNVCMKCLNRCKFHNQLHR